MHGPWRHRLACVVQGCRLTGGIIDLCLGQKVWALLELSQGLVGRWVMVCSQEAELHLARFLHWEYL